MNRSYEFRRANPKSSKGGRLACLLHNSDYERLFKVKISLLVGNFIPISGKYLQEGVLTMSLFNHEKKRPKLSREDLLAGKCTVDDPNSNLDPRFKSPDELLLEY